MKSHEYIVICGFNRSKVEADILPLLPQLYRSFYSFTSTHTNRMAEKLSH